MLAKLAYLTWLSVWEYFVQPDDPKNAGEQLSYLFNRIYMHQVLSS